MVRRKYGTSGKYTMLAAALLCIVLGLLTSCGQKEELTETQMGIDGYVYVPRLLDTSAGETDNKAYDFKVSGNNLYYFYSAEPGSILERLPLLEESAALGGQGMDFGAGEKLLELPGGYYEETEEILEEWNRDPGSLMD